MLKIGVNAKFFVFLEQKFVMWGGVHVIIIVLEK